jgi:dTDP-4-dehydrorhamnose reductase
MILLIGSSGYIGGKFAHELRERDFKFVSVDREQCRYGSLLNIIESENVEFIINAAGYVGKPNVDVCESNKDLTLEGNVYLPMMISAVCLKSGINWGHVSSGCIYSGDNEGKGFKEDDEPNFSFSSPPCSFYSGTKALCEKAISQFENCYIWRLRVPFDNIDNSRNYLTKLMNYDRLLNVRNSLSHVGDFVGACLDLVEKDATLGIYNITNVGSVTTKEVVSLIKRIVLDKEVNYFLDECEFNDMVESPRSNCVLNTDKILENGVILRPVLEALEDSLNSWVN